MSGELYLEGGCLNRGVFAWTQTPCLHGSAIDGTGSPNPLPVLWWGLGQGCGLGGEGLQGYVDPRDEAAGYGPAQGLAKANTKEIVCCFNGFGRSTAGKGKVRGHRCARAEGDGGDKTWG